MVTKINLNDTKIVVGQNAIKNIDKELKEIKYSQVFILVDENTHQYCLPQLILNSKTLKNADVIEIESGEEQKTLDTSFQLWEVLTEYRADRNTLIINLGGGVITDIGGFVASVYKRGVKFINIPTTLLAQVDAAIGGKTGIDVGNLKNILGTFAHPELIIVDPDFLDTLDSRNIYSGLAEVIKHSLIYDSKYWDDIKKSNLEDIEAIKNLITESVKIKTVIVGTDPKEKGLRKILNFGHTIGHAVEALNMYSKTNFLYHGEAIAIGMICELYLSILKLDFPEDKLVEISTFLNSIFTLKKIKKKDYDILIELMTNDKKNEDAKISFSLLEDIGICSYNVFCDEEDIVNAFNFYNKIIS